MPTTCKTICINSLCRRRKACACKCEAELARYPALIGGCQSACFADTNYMNGKSTETLLCSDPQGAFNKLGYICKNFDPDKGTVQGQQYTREKTQELDNSKQSMKYVFIGLAVLLLALALYLIF